MLGSASDLMGQLLAKGHAASFDLVFVDANKTGGVDGFVLTHTTRKIWI